MASFGLVWFGFLWMAYGRWYCIFKFLKLGFVESCVTFQIFYKISHTWSAFLFGYQWTLLLKLVWFYQSSAVFDVCYRPCTWYKIWCILTLNINYLYKLQVISTSIRLMKLLRYLYFSIGYWQRKIEHFKNSSRSGKSICKMMLKLGSQKRQSSLEGKISLTFLILEEKCEIKSANYAPLFWAKHKFLAKGIFTSCPFCTVY